MIYEFIHEPTGEIVEIPYSVKEAPPLDSEIIHKGRVVRRIISTSIAVNGHPATGQYPVFSSSLPTTLAEDGSCQLGRERPGGRLKPVIESAQHKRELMAKFDLVDGI